MEPPPLKACNVLLSHLQMQDLLNLRLVSVAWRKAVSMYDNRSNNVLVSCAIPADCNPDSPMDRVMMAAAEQRDVLENAERGVFREYPLRRVDSILGASSSTPRAVIFVGHCVALIGDSSWGLYERLAEGDPTPHLIETYDASKDVRYVVLRDRFLMLLIGGMLLSLDCGEIFDLPIILKTQVPDGSVLHGSHENCLLSEPSGHHFIFAHHETAPFGYHAEQVHDFSITSSKRCVVGLCDFGRRVLFKKNDQLEARCFESGHSIWSPKVYELRSARVVAEHLIEFETASTRGVFSLRSTDLNLISEKLPRSYSGGHRVLCCAGG